MGVAHHTSFLVWFEVGRTEFTRAVELTFAYEVLRQPDGALLGEGQTVHAATDLTGRVRRIPEESGPRWEGAGGTTRRRPNNL